jgi:hypothetical protein
MEEAEKPVTSIKTPMRLEYRYSAGVATSRFLHGIAQGKIISDLTNRKKRKYMLPNYRRRTRIFKCTVPNHVGSSTGIFFFSRLE